VGVGLSDLRSLNPEFRADMVPYFGTPCNFRLPAVYASIYQSKKDSLIYWIGNKQGFIPIIKTDTIAVVEGDSSINLVVAKGDQSVTDSAGVTPPVPKTILTTPADKKIWVYYRVKSGDAVYTLSDIFDCTPEQLKSWNRVSGNNLQVGASLKFYVLASKKGYYLKLNSLTTAQKRNIAGVD
jgi:LysM repeat protein